MKALPVEKEIVVEPHAGVGAARVGSLKRPTVLPAGGSRGVPGRAGRREKEAILCEGGRVRGIASS